MKARIAIIIAVLVVGIGGAIWLAADDPPQDAVATQTQSATDDVATSQSTESAEPTAEPAEPATAPRADEGVYEFPGEPLLFPWGDGFLELIVHHGGPGQSLSMEAATSPDGVTWTPVTVTLPDDLGEGYVAASAVAGRRLALSYMVWTDDGAPGDSAILETEDLETWRVVRLPAPDLPTDLPDHMVRQSQIEAIAAGDAGWVALRTNATFFEPEKLLPADVLQSEQGYGIGITDDGIDFDPDGGERRLFTWEELGIDPVVGADLMNEDHRVEAWFSPWGGQPVATQLEDLQWAASLASNGAEFVMAGYTQTGGSQLLRSTDGITWEPLAGSLLGDVNMLAPIDGGFLAQVWRQSGPAIVTTTDGGATWQTVDAAGLPDQEQMSLHVRNSSASPGVATVAFIHDQPMMFEPPPVTYEHDGHQITIHSGQRGATVVIVDLATGLTVLDATHELPTDEEIRALEEAGDVEALEALFEQEPPWARYGDEATEYLDPQTGQLIVSVPFEVQSDAFDDAYRELDQSAEMTGPPQMWLLATSDGQDWLSVQLAEDAFVFGSGVAAVNGDVVVVNQGGDHIVYSLG